MWENHSVRNIWCENKLPGMRIYFMWITMQGTWGKGLNIIERHQLLFDLSIDLILSSGAGGLQAAGSLNFSKDVKLLHQKGRV